VPGPNEEYFIYQTLVGAWPLDPAETETFLERLQKTLVKAWREAKQFTSWSSPDSDYETAVAEFVATILTPAAENHFLPDFSQFQRRISFSAVCVSLAQTLIRLVSPGVPDIYQGAELWELSMVDPDNRRPVDFAKSQALLSGIANRNAADLLKTWQCGSVKQFVIQKTLEFRRENAEVFRSGEYIPLEAVGAHSVHVLAFARHSGMTWSIAVAPRFPGKFSRLSWPSLAKGLLTDTELSFPPNAPRHWVNIFTGEKIEVSGDGRLPMATLLRRFPIALLTALPD
jgi:(1->4)-alpha-D-glucan 1-alpha-D-glucosylmutase